MDECFWKFKQFFSRTPVDASAWVNRSDYAEDRRLCGIGHKCSVLFKKIRQEKNRFAMPLPMSMPMHMLMRKCWCRNFHIALLFFFSLDLLCLDTLYTANRNTRTSMVGDIKLHFLNPKLHLRCLTGYWIHLCILNYFPTRFFRNSQQRRSVKKVFLEISQNPQKNTCARVYFLIKQRP